MAGDNTYYSEPPYQGATVIATFYNRLYSIL